MIPRAFFAVLAVLAIVTWTPAAATADSKSPSSDPSQPFSLNDLYTLALAEAESIKRAQEDVLIAEKDKDRARAVLIPRFTAFGSYSWTDAAQDTDPAQPTMPASLDLTTDSLAWGLRFDQSFTLNGKELTALSISKDIIEKSGLDLNTQKESYLYQVAGAYYNVLRAQKGWEIAKASVRRLETHRDAVKARLRLEDVTKTDMYRAESELSDAQAKLIEDRNRFMLARAGLRSLVRLPEDFELQEPDAQTGDLPIPSLETLKEEGLSKRTEIKSARLAQTVSEKSVKLAKGDYWPSLSVEGQYGKQNDDNSGDLSFDQDTTAYKLAANVTFTLFDGGLRSAEITQSRARERQARLALSETRKQILLDIEDAYLQVMTQKSRLASLNDKLSFSKQNFTAVSQQFKHGLSNSVDMMDANTLLVSAERELADAEFGFKLSILKLKRSVGSFLDETVRTLSAR
ncbi:TolC family protein [Desulfatiferula olefinivorans]